MTRRSLRNAVYHQVVLREVNDRLLELADGDVGEFICECARPECIEKIFVPIEDYRRLRDSDPTSFIADARRWFIVDAGHVDGAYGHVIESHEAWSVVETDHPDFVPETPDFSLDE